MHLAHRYSRFFRSRKTCQSRGLRVVPDFSVSHFLVNSCFGKNGKSRSSHRNISSLTLRIAIADAVAISTALAARRRIRRICARDLVADGTILVDMATGHVHDGRAAKENQATVGSALSAPAGRVTMRSGATRRSTRGEHAERSDRQLVSRFVARRDEAAFREMVRRHGPMVLGVCRRMLGEVHAAEDAFQATFLVLARDARKIRCRKSLASWMRRVSWRTVRPHMNWQLRKLERWQ